MATYTVALKDLSSFYRNLSKERVAQALDIVRREVKTMGLRMVQEEIASRRPPPVDRGTYRRTWQATNIPNGVQIHNPTAYASVIEAGRRAGARMPPPDVIGEWARRKGLLRGTPKGSMKSAQRSIGFVIARAIARRGQPPQHILRDAMRRFRPHLERVLREALQSTVVR